MTTRDLLDELIIRFDTNPKLYEKLDFKTLLDVLESLLDDDDDFKIKFEELISQLDEKPSIEDVQTLIPTKVSQLDNDANYLKLIDILNKADKSDIPTKVSQLTNDSGYITNASIDAKANKADVYTKTESDSKYLTEHQSLIEYLKSADAAITYATKEEISGLGIQLKKVDVLPETGLEKIIYLVPKTKAEVENIFEEYIWIENKWEKIGTTSLDLTGYAKELWVKDQGYLTEHQDISGKQDKINDLDSIREGASKGATALQSFTEKDPIFEASAASGITTDNITSWNNKSDFSGNYNDLTNKPSIPSIDGLLSKTEADGYYLVKGNYLTSEKDPIFSASVASSITADNITSWNNKSNFSGNYSDLNNKPTFKTINNKSIIASGTDMNIEIVTTFNWDDE